MKRVYQLLPFILAFPLSFALQVLWGQVSYQKEKLPPVPRHMTINMSEIEAGFDVAFEYPEAPYPSGDSYRAFLQARKEQIAEKYPLKQEPVVRPRSSADAPVILESFLGNNSTNGRPLDNHLAVSNDGQVVSVINVHFAVFNPDGSWIKGINFSNLFFGLPIDNRIFDPRIMYDPVEDRWILAMKAGSDCDDSGFVFGFSQTNDAAGTWHFYVFDGCPKDNNTFADFPMMAITQDEFFYTYNAVDESLSWQEGFVETIIIQVNKHNGYAGEELQLEMWSDITYGGKPIRNLCPVKSATEELYTNCYFLSNRNFAFQNDTFFVLEVTGPLTDPEHELKIDVRLTDVPYGLPPDARQPQGSLATNDARVLDAIRYDDWIQFVGNTIHIDNGNSTIYHGYIENISDLKAIHGYVLEHADTELGLIDLGYPGIAYTGLNPSDRDVIIVASHANNAMPPGNSACYAGQDESHSEWVDLKTGDSYIDMILEQDLERWGDYAGAQRKYNEPGIVWVSASFGQSDKRNNTWVSSLQPADQASSVRDESTDLNVSAFPNPAQDRLQLRFTLPEIQKITANVYDLQGRLVDRIGEITPRQAGEIVMHFSTAPLGPGTYVIEVKGEREFLFSHKIVVE